jgi:hypothetical protein
MHYAASRSPMIAFLLLGLAAAPLASAGESHGYPQTTSSYSSFSQSSESRTTEEVEGAWSDEDASQYGEAGGHRAWREKAEQYGSDRYGYSAEGYSSERFAHGYGRRIADSDVDENGVGYLPVSFFSDAGGVGPYGDFGNGGGGGGFVYGGGFASGFAGAHASASASASATISITGGFHGGWRGGGMHGGYPHGGGHGCGCK